MDMVFGWRRDLPDVRDYTEENPVISSILEKSEPLKKVATKAAPAATPPVLSPMPLPPPKLGHSAAPVTAAKLPTSTDLKKYCSPIEDQGNLGSCTANACAGLVEYFQNRAFGKYTNTSRLFIYKTTRNLLGWTGDTGAYLRSTMRALVMFGAPPEQYWPYSISKYDTEPTAFLYAFGENYKAIRYYRLDNPGMTPDATLSSIKTKLAAGLPCMFGFSVYSSISNSPDIPFPTSRDSLLGGHAIVAIGYDDSRKIGSNTGALLIRNSWGTSWGDAGYGWLPYAYVTKGLAADFWTLVQADFVDSDLFK